MGSEKKNFIGVVGLDARMSVVEAIRGCFENKKHFSVSAINSLDDYDYSTFAQWAQNLHCVDWAVMGEEKKERLKAYIVNYFLCPAADDVLDVLAVMNEVWPPAPVVVEEVTKTVSKAVTPFWVWPLVVVLVGSIGFMLIHR